MDGRMRSAQIEMAKEDLLETCKTFYREKQKLMTYRRADTVVAEILHKTEELMRLQREIP
jgi:hypothetical protein